MLEFESNCQNEQLGALNILETSLISSVFDGTGAESESTDPLFLLDQLPSSLWANSPTNVVRIRNVHFNKVLFGPSNLFQNSSNPLS